MPSDEYMCCECPLPSCNRKDARCFYPLKDRSAEYRKPQERQRIAKWKRENRDKVNAINKAYRVRKQQQEQI